MDRSLRSTIYPRSLNKARTQKSGLLLQETSSLISRLPPDFTVGAIGPVAMTQHDSGVGVTVSYKAQQRTGRPVLLRWDTPGSGL